MNPSLVAVNPNERVTVSTEMGDANFAQRSVISRRLVPDGTWFVVDTLNAGASATYPSYAVPTELQVLTQHKDNGWVKSSDNRVSTSDVVTKIEVEDAEDPGSGDYNDQFVFVIRITCQKPDLAAADLNI